MKLKKLTKGEIENNIILVVSTKIIIYNSIVRIRFQNLRRLSYETN